MSDQSITVVPAELARRTAAAMFEVDHAARGMGIEVVEISPGNATLAMVVRDEMVNGHAIAHGGYIFALADTAMAYASNTYNRVAVAQTASVTFAAPGRKGERLTAEAIERHRGGRTAVYDVTVNGQDGRMVAVFRGITQTIKGEVVPGLSVASEEK